MHGLLLTLVLLVQVLMPRGVQLLLGSTAPGLDVTAARQVLAAPSPENRTPVDDQQTPGENEGTEEDDDSDQDDPVWVQVHAIAPSPSACISLGSAHRPATIPGEVAVEVVQARGPPSA